jgi:hypothetical protein
MVVRDKFGVTPVGSPVRNSETAELNPVPAVVVRVMGMELPDVTVPLIALAARVKVGGVMVKGTF